MAWLKKAKELGIAALASASVAAYFHAEQIADEIWERVHGVKSTAYAEVIDQSRQHQKDLAAVRRQAQKATDLAARGQNNITAGLQAERAGDTPAAIKKYTAAQSDLQSALMLLRAIDEKGLAEGLERFRETAVQARLSDEEHIQAAADGLAELIASLNQLINNLTDTLAVLDETLNQLRIEAAFKK